MPSFCTGLSIQKTQTHNKITSGVTLWTEIAHIYKHQVAKLMTHQLESQDNINRAMGDYVLWKINPMVGYKEEEKRSRGEEEKKTNERDGVKGYLFLMKYKVFFSKIEWFWVESFILNCKIGSMGNWVRSYGFVFRVGCIISRNVFKQSRKTVKLNP